MEWQPIETAPVCKDILLFFPEKVTGSHGQMKLPIMIKADTYPVSYPRQPTHWMPLPPPPSLYTEK